jgi:hypothetical protein
MPLQAAVPDAGVSERARHAQAITLLLLTLVFFALAGAGVYCWLAPKPLVFRDHFLVGPGSAGAHFARLETEDPLGHRPGVVYWDCGSECLVGEPVARLGPFTLYRTKLSLPALNADLLPRR